MGMKSFRDAYPQYDSVPDEVLIKRLSDQPDIMYKHFYSGMDRSEFDRKFAAKKTGVNPAKAEKVAVEEPFFDPTIDRAAFLPMGYPKDREKAKKEGATTQFATPGVIKNITEAMTVPGRALGFGKPISDNEITNMALSLGLPLMRSVGSATSRLKPARMTRSRVRKAPTTQQVKDEAQKIYRAIDNSGLTLTEKSVYDLFLKLDNVLTRGNVNKLIEKKTLGTLRNIKKDYSGKKLKIKEIQNIRELIKKVKNDTNPTTSGKDKFLSGKLLTEINKHLSGLTKKDVVRGDPSKITPKLKEADKLWSQYKKSERIDLAQKDALNFDNPQSAIRSSMRKELSKNIKNNNTLYSPNETAALEKIVLGSTPAKIARGVSKLAPAWSVNQLSLGGIGAYGGYTTGIGVPLTIAAIQGAGTIAKPVARSLTNKAVREARATMASGNRDATMQAMGRPGTATTRGAMGQALQMPSNQPILQQDDPRAANRMARQLSSGIATDMPPGSIIEPPKNLGELKERNLAEYLKMLLEGA
mgnify:CR=1 FL=1